MGGSSCSGFANWTGRGKSSGVPLPEGLEERMVRPGVLSFGYRVRREEGLLILRCPDVSLMAAFAPGAADPFEV